MSYDYLIEIRPLVEKLRLKQKIHALKKEIRLRKTSRVPHLTLIYNFKPKIPNYRLAELIKETASKYENLKFEYHGWDFNESKRVFVFKIKPSEDLKDFRYELYNNIKNFIIEDPETKKYNIVPKDDFWFHLSIATHLDKTKAERIDKFTTNKKTFLDKLANYLKGKDTTHTEHTRRSMVFPSEVARIPILRSGKITYEYDKFTNRILKRRDALSKNYKRLSLMAFRKKENLEVIPSNVKDQKNQIWFISDTHFDHANIINLCARPFADVNEMNNILVGNWNYTVNKQDKVYFLGDMGNPKNYWLNKLNGEIVFIEGNHDKDKKNTRKYEKLDYKGHKFLLLHDPKDKPKEWSDWIIHGDKHDNNLENFPFINWEQKTVNVCVELIKYSPVNFDKIIELIENKKEQNILILD